MIQPSTDLLSRSMNAFEELMRIVPPPAHPFDGGSHEHLLSVEKMFGLTLPGDFKRLTLTYGTGCWQGFWYLLNPSTSNQHLNLITHLQKLRPKGWSALDAERTLHEQLGIAYPHAIFPEPGGILPWAVTDNGGRFFWLTAGAPETWSTVYYPDRDPDYCVYNMSSAEIVLGAVSGTLPIFADVFGPDFVYGQSDAFEPMSY